MTTHVLGLDVGGANLKAAHSNGVARCVAFALWKQPEGLTAELGKLSAAMPGFDRLAITMTGELCDCFETKRAGVQAILQSVAAMAGTTPILVWSTRGRFLSMAEAMNEPHSVAAANWLAQAQLVARRLPDECALLIDTGSTTTDIVYLDRGVPQPRGYSDSERLSLGELVYTGVRRTPICSVLGMDVAAEFFATMLDAYILTGRLPEDAHDCDTADGRPATHAFAHARLARMHCADAETYSAEQARRLAERALRMQWRTVKGAIKHVVTGRSPVQRIVVSGSGDVLGRSLLAGTATPITCFSDLFGPDLSAAACAYAVAVLAAEETANGR